MPVEPVKPLCVLFYKPTRLLKAKLLAFVLFFLTLTTLAQSKSERFTVSGTVKDSKNEPVAGANVRVSDGSSTATNGEGKFVLKTSKKPPFDVVCV